ncbi:MAG: cytochrome c biogenesis protein CcsA [Armatimonadetes bacterium]|nr:cytochrome c biogenesis protein CcsA [Armatimonadota bacterium]
MQASVLGQGLVYLALILSILTLVTMALRKRVAETLWGLATGTVVAATMLLLGALLRSDFRIDYVVGHTSRDLAWPYKMAALWAGQEGTNLLWAFITLWVVHSLWRTRDAAGQEDALSARAATLAMAMVVGLMALLVVRSPFAPVAGELPADGRGLNPLLENPWMIIHPPVLFVGYSLLFAPTALAMAGWWRGDGSTWVDLGRRYALWGWVFLGAGMMLGGYWAYITLGWGGFWAWDPVENASLVPWLVATALLHGFAVQRRGGACARLNYIIALLGTVVIIFGAYLTRSGVLADFSVHSFADLGAAYNNAWLALLFVPLVAGLAIFAARRKQVPAQPMPDTVFWLHSGLWLVIAMAALVWVGMSMPLLSKLVGEPFAVQMAYYNKTQTLLFAASAVALIAHLRPRGAGTWVALSVVGIVAVGLLLGIMKPETVRSAQVGLALNALVTGAMAALGLVYAFRGQRAGQLRQVGTGLAHTGMALVVLGAMLSVNGERSQKLEVPVGGSQPTPWGKVGLGQPEETKRGRLRLPLTLDGAKRLSEFFTTEQGQMRNPVVYHRVWGDVYVAPEGMNEPGLVKLAKGDTAQADGVSVTFEQFKVDGMHADAGDARVGAQLKVEDGKTTSTVTPMLRIDRDMHKVSEAVTLGNRTIELVDLDVDNHAVMIKVRQGTGKDVGQTGPQLLVQVTRKPGIQLVWLGTLVLLSGGLVALRRPRAKGDESVQQLS